MSENSAIEWTDHTWNPWWGCTEVSPGCDHCYARTLAERWHRAEWGRGKPRMLTSAANWQQPLKWDRKAAEAGTRPRVFCASMADVFDAEVPASWRVPMWDLIRRTPNLDWLLLTKRPNLIRRYLPADWGEGYPNVRLMTTVESQRQSWRADALLKVPAVAYGLSVEPMIGPVDVSPYLPAVDWVIVGGESGAKHRPLDLDWARTIRDQCREAGAAFFFKQHGGRTPKAGGCLLDGVEWKQFPAVPA